ncbi:lipocalin family protein [Flavivirga jejuensis]|uniref:Lipocalin family protein n=1 Tax=Flavivirga jejuensis TaxID=870487 RepID=A0ABT8WPD9_9FLAO|nr:lipocalin family protein [Flavivirga jejuensis]MDO5975014.1 lipocalin family protein [Flavivirga jejuensis]
MKLQHYIMGLMLIVFSLFQTVSAQTIQEQLIGTWTFDYQASLGSMTQKSKDHYNKMDASRQSKLSTTYKDRKITFNSDDSYVQVLSDGRTTNANWTINSKNNLEFKLPNGRTIPFKIVTLQNNTLILSQIKSNAQGSLKILFTNWHLTKN